MSDNQHQRDQMASAQRDQEEEPRSVAADEEEFRRAEQLRGFSGDYLLTRIIGDTLVSGTRYAGLERGRRQLSPPFEFSGTEILEEATRRLNAYAEICDG